MVETPLARLVLARHARFAMRSMMPGRSCRRLKPGLSRLSRHGKVLPPSPPAQKATARQDQAREAGSDNRAVYDLQPSELTSEQVFYDAPHPCIASADDIHSSAARPKQQPSHGSIWLYDRH